MSPPYDHADITSLMALRIVVDVLGAMVSHGKMGAHHFLKLQLEKVAIFNNGKACAFEDIGCKFQHQVSPICKVQTVAKQKNVSALSSKFKVSCLLNIKIPHSYSQLKKNRFFYQY